MKPLSELLGPGFAGRPFEAPWKQPKPPVDWDTMLGDRWLAETFGHTHQGPAIPPPAPPAPTPSPTPRPEPTPVPAIRVTFRATDTRLGEDGTPGDRFDSATLKYVGFDVDIPGEFTSYFFSGCWIERAATGTRFLAQTSHLVDVKTGRMVFRGGVGLGRGGTWLPGEYRLRCEAEGVSIPENTFVVTGELTGWTGQETVGPFRPDQAPARERISQDHAVF